MTCSRTWQAEAIEDGRLEAQDQASFERHLLQCGECAREASALHALHDELAQLQPRELSVLEERRQRAQLLRRANQLAVAPRRTFRRTLVLCGAAALLALGAIGVIGASWLGPAASSRPVVAQRAAPVFELRAVGGASFHDQTRGSNGRVVLTGGALAVHVEHLRRGQRFVVAVPDGELEVHGTRFIVEVEAGHTQRVLVTEGVVALRLAGSPEQRLVAGSSWSRRPPSAADDQVLVETLGASDSAGPGEPTRERAQQGPGGRARMRLRGNPDRAASTHGTHESTAIVEQNTDAGAALALGLSSAAPHEFAAAMQAFQAGEYLDADERLASFVARFPADPRDEDAAFLRAVIATKRGDAAAAVARARDYVKRFPSGLRHIEMQRLLNAPW